MDNVLLAFGLTVFAGLSTGIGSAIAFFAKTTSKKFLSISLGFSAGVMIYVSMIEIFFKAQDSLIAALGVKRGELEKAQLVEFGKKHGMPGFAPTQGHIPSGVPFVGFAIDEMKAGKLEKVMIVGKGSLFLGRMTNLFDGVSFVMENNKGIEEEVKGIDEGNIKLLIADAMRKLAQNLAE